MAHHHHGPGCNHDHEHEHDPHTHRQLAAQEEPMDAANQSLSDALRASFGVLKLIMIVLIVLYLFSNVRRVDSHEQAVVLRLGELQPKTYDAGLVWAFPFPIDEIVPLPTKKSNEITVDSHTFMRLPEEIGKPLSFIARGMSGLNPALDGALLTADAGLVHAQWKVQYKIEDVRSYISNIKTRKLEAAEELIRRLVETVGIETASEHTAEEMIRTRVDAVQSQLTQRVNDRLDELKSGLRVTRIEMFEPTPPLPVRPAFDETQRAENRKRKLIRDADQEKSTLLNETAGAAWSQLITALDKVEVLRAEQSGGTNGANGQQESNGAEELAQAEAEVDRLLLEDVEGKVGRMIKDATSYLSVVVGEMQGDVELYRTLLPEYKRDPELLVARLWEQTRQEILNDEGVVKMYRPPGTQIRLKIPYDREQAKIEEEKRLKDREFDPKKLRPERWVPVGPEAD